MKPPDRKKPRSCCGCEVFFCCRGRPQFPYLTYSVIHPLREKRGIVQGLDGYLVAENDGSLLICRLSEEQRIGEFSQQP